MNFLLGFLVNETLQMKGDLRSKYASIKKPEPPVIASDYRKKNDEVKLNGTSELTMTSVNELSTPMILSALSIIAPGQNLGNLTRNVTTDSARSKRHFHRTKVPRKDFHGKLRSATTRPLKSLGATSNATSSVSHLLQAQDIKSHNFELKDSDFVKLLDAFSSSSVVTRPQTSSALLSKSVIHSGRESSNNIVNNTEPVISSLNLDSNRSPAASISNMESVQENSSFPDFASFLSTSTEEINEVTILMKLQQRTDNMTTDKNLGNETNLEVFEEVLSSSTAEPMSTSSFVKSASNRIPTIDDSLKTSKLWEIPATNTNTTSMMFETMDWLREDDTLTLNRELRERSTMKKEMQMNDTDDNFDNKKGISGLSEKVSELDGETPLKIDIPFSVRASTKLRQKVNKIKEGETSTMENEDQIHQLGHIFEPWKQDSSNQKISASQQTVMSTGDQLDSEHSSTKQCLKPEKKEEIEKDINFISTFNVPFYERVNDSGLSTLSTKLKSEDCPTNSRVQRFEESPSFSENHNTDNTVSSKVPKKENESCPAGSDCYVDVKSAFGTENGSTLTEINLQPDLRNQNNESYKSKVIVSESKTVTGNESSIRSFLESMKKGTKINNFSQTSLNKTNFDNDVLTIVKNASRSNVSEKKNITSPENVYIIGSLGYFKESQEEFPEIEEDFGKRRESLFDYGGASDDAVLLLEEHNIRKLPEIVEVEIETPDSSTSQFRWEGNLVDRYDESWWPNDDASSSKLLDNSFLKEKSNIIYMRKAANKIRKESEKLQSSLVLTDHFTPEESQPDKSYQLVHLSIFYVVMAICISLVIFNVWCKYMPVLKVPNFPTFCWKHRQITKAVV
ncbi:uncharacterized protein LOC105694835 isoform X2 [Orussus abietinus]|uniref:uncharacterized protein LOC105694835 isoform X2 n=1 Tax=Orussus abietinus TaxID=222816 RepID=UPI000626269A|nr:uncharacterized protein LOC105694835 isoform X2 [Orussus abietinus]